MRKYPEYVVLRWEGTEEQLRKGLQPQQYGYAHDIDRVMLRTLDGRLRYFAPDPEWDEAMGIVRYGDR